MPTILTSEQILALAPDASSAKDGKGLANSRKWVTLGHNERAVWGECQGSGKFPYQTQIDLAETSFKCSCPSRKFPCKHSLGLFLLLNDQAAAFTQTEPPDWVKQWIEGREKRAEQKKVKAENPTTVDVAAQTKRAEQREAKVTAGLNELELWMRDLVRQGLAQAQSKPYSFWDKPALRLEDAQAKGAARLVRDLAGIPASGDGWHSRLLEKLGRIYLLIEGYKRLGTLPVGTQADIRTLVGWTQNTEEILATATPENTVRDCWQVLGQSLDNDEKIKTRRTWLWGQQSQKLALILHFAAPGQPMDTSVIYGSQFEAELVFYPSNFPLRALVKERFGLVETIQNFPGYPDITAAYHAYTDALVRNPWLEEFPLSLQNVIPVLDKEKDQWLICDTEKRYLPIAKRFSNNWHLLALSGGKPISIFGEWDGYVFFPLSVGVENRFIAV